MKVYKILKIVVLVMYCLLTVKSDECNNSEIVEGRFGEERVLSFPFANLKDKFMKSIASWHGEFKMKNEINVQDLKKEVKIRLRNKMDSGSRQIIFEDGSPTDVSARTEIFMTNDAFVVKITNLQKEDAGMYWIEFRFLSLGKKYLIVAGKPTIKGQSPPNPVLKPEDNYKTTLQLECDSISTSIGDCHSMFILWYKNGMRMAYFDPRLSKINVTVDPNGGTFTCLATEYRSCYHKLQTTKYYNVVNIEECDNVFESETFTVRPQYAPTDVKLQPDQREITVNKGENLKVRCSAKCYPKCNVAWKKDSQNLESSYFGNSLRIENIRSTNEGTYSCLVNNDHGEAEKNFILKIRETEENDITIVVVAVVSTIFVAVAVVVVVIALYRNDRRKKRSTTSNQTEADAEVSPHLLAPYSVDTFSLDTGVYTDASSHPLSPYSVDTDVDTSSVDTDVDTDVSSHPLSLSVDTDVDTFSVYTDVSSHPLSLSADTDVYTDVSSHLSVPSSIDTDVAPKKKKRRDMTSNLPEDKSTEFPPVSANPNPVQQPDWCKCTNCREMPTYEKKLCCGMEPTLCRSLSPEVEYIIENTRIKQDLTLRRGQDISELYMHEAYREYALLFYGKFGLGNRRLVPSCVVWKIRDRYPSISEEYTGFKSS